MLKKLKDAGQIGNKVAVVNVGDDFGIELANAGRPLFKQAGFEIVYDKSYPLGTQDYAPVIKAAKAANPDAFVAWSYPPDTFGLAEQAKIEGLNVKAYYSAVATALPGLLAEVRRRGRERARSWRHHRFAGDPRLLQARTKKLPASTPTTGAARSTTRCSQVLTQSIEGVGSMDRDAIAAHFRNHKFKTIIGELEMPQPAARQVLDRRPVAERILQRRGRRRLHRLRRSI